MCQKGEDMNYLEFKTKYLRTQELAEWINVVNIVKKVKLGKVTLLTGNNGSGKSLIRGLLGGKAVKELGTTMSQVSMETRTKQVVPREAMSSTMLDDSELATSLNTVNLIEKLCSTLETKPESSYICFDEFEIGCGEEMQLTLINYVNEITKKYPQHGFLIITHSRLVVENLEYDDFINIQGLDKSGWLNRKIRPASLAKLKENRLFELITSLKSLNKMDRSKVTKLWKD